MLGRSILQLDHIIFSPLFEGVKLIFDIDFRHFWGRETITTTGRFFIRSDHRKIRYRKSSVVTNIYVKSEDYDNINCLHWHERGGNITHVTLQPCNRTPSRRRLLYGLVPREMRPGVFEAAARLLLSANLINLVKGSCRGLFFWILERWSGRHFCGQIEFEEFGVNYSLTYKAW